MEAPNKMTRQVDIKALISHLVRGDGADRCRICMGDTTEGQVYLGDTVMMDGDRPVTLSELLEVITGVEVLLDEDLPGGLCSKCTELALSAATFRNFCLQSSEHWHSAVHHLESLYTFKDCDDKKSLYAVIKLEGNQINVTGVGVEDDQCNAEYLSDQSDDELYSDSKIKIDKQMLLKTGNENLNCPDCRKSFMNPQALYDHLKDSSENKRACYICGIIMSQDDLVVHLKIDHNSALYSCKKCPALLRNAKQLFRHLAKAHRPGAYFCGDCNHSFISKHALHGHLNLHLSKNCPSCDKLFRNRKCYTIHVKECCNLDMTREDTHRTKTKVMFEVENINDNKKLKVGARGSADKECICDYCGKKYAGKKFVSAHIQIIHMKNTHRPCPYCGKFFAAAHMTEHIKRHEKVQIFTCEQCGCSLKTRLGYIQHLRLHTGEKPYKCKYCTATFSASSRRSEHVRKSHKTPDQILLKHSCTLCPAKFRLPYRLKHHIKTVHSKKIDNTVVLDFECIHCHIKFSSYRGLLYHSKKHQTCNLKPMEKDNITQ